jgi:hypothetical protein
MSKGPLPPSSATGDSGGIIRTDGPAQIPGDILLKIEDIVIIKAHITRVRRAAVSFEAGQRRSIQVGLAGVGRPNAQITVTHVFVVHGGVRV